MKYQRKKRDKNRYAAKGLIWFTVTLITHGKDAGKLCATISEHRKLSKYKHAQIFVPNDVPKGQPGLRNGGECGVFKIDDTHPFLHIVDGGSYVAHVEVDVSNGERLHIIAAMTREEFDAASKDMAAKVIKTPEVILQEVLDPDERVALNVLAKSRLEDPRFSSRQPKFNSLGRTCTPTPAK